MSTSIEQFIVHRILITNEGKLTFLPRGSVFEVNEQITLLGTKLHTTFNSKPGKGVGGFIAEKNEFNNLLDLYLAGKHDFHDFSVALGKRLLNTIISENMVEAGFVVFSKYEYLATDYLLIAMLDTKEHVEVNQYLEISQSQHLDLAKMQIAVRINLTDYAIQKPAARYISFLKGRMGRRVSDFFMQFVGCEELVDTKQQNKQFAQQVDEYLAAEGLDRQEKFEHRDAVVDYYKQQVALGENIELEAIDKVLPLDTSGNSSFSQYNAKQSQPIEESFMPDKTVLQSMKKFSGAGGGLHIGFDKKLLGERIMVDLDSDTITIKGIPPNLKDQLLKDSL